MVWVVVVYVYGREGGGCVVVHGMGVVLIYVLFIDLITASFSAASCAH